MGTITKGILGGFSGKVGSVVGGSWKGIDYMRSQSSRRTRAASVLQLQQQQKCVLQVRIDTRAHLQYTSAAWRIY